MHSNEGNSEALGSRLQAIWPEFWRILDIFRYFGHFECTAIRKVAIINAKMPKFDMLMDSLMISKRAKPIILNNESNVY